MAYSKDDEPFPLLPIHRPVYDTVTAIGIYEPSRQISIVWNRIVEHHDYLEILSYFTNCEKLPMMGQVEVHTLKNGKSVSNGYIVDNRSESIGACMLVASGLKEPAEILELVERAMEIILLEDLIPPDLWIDHGTD